MTENKTRQPAGVPVGGQFAATAHAEPTNIQLRRTTADEDREYAIDHLESRDFNTLHISDEDKELLGRALRREPVAVEDIDAVLERNWEAEYPGPDSDTYYSGIATQVFDAVRAERASSGIPSTVPTLANFDPATQSVLGSDEARRRPALGLAELKASIDESDAYTSRAAHQQRDLDYIERLNATGVVFLEDRRAPAARLAGALAGAGRSDAKSAAIITEMRWLAENDEEFAKAGGTTVAEVLKLKTLQPDADQNTPIAPSIRKVQARA